ncbi:MAG: MBL fold metallo-hydrolase [Candidatus Poseidoniaceae archaeon]|nr:MBL fold metallo-hydrolase [Candidatus Poseidoniaceae archaeon]MBL6896170.1 MBL fold metallo-hydrolase [Candidatus Poseidoniaceae archaeon]MDC3245338.1 MBL fold metallo-hydrolase [bacterium]
MTLRITHLGTGSRGNSTLLETSEVKVLVDLGFSGAQLQKRLAMLNITPEEIDCALISHHHGDHGGGANIAQRKWGMNILANERTAQELDLDPKLTSYFGPLDVIRIGDQLSILTVPVPHSGSENVAFVASYGGERAAIITDLGSWTDELIKHVYGCEHISIEANYDDQKLNSGPYPYSLKERIRGRGGHLSNNQTGQFLAQVSTKNTRNIILTHLSEKNNSPHLAESTVLYYISELFEGDIFISSQDGPEMTHYIGENDIENLTPTKLNRVEID